MNAGSISIHAIIAPIVYLLQCLANPTMDLNTYDLVLISGIVSVPNLLLVLSRLSKSSI